MLLSYWIYRRKSICIVEKREYIFTDDIEWIYKHNNKKNLQTIGIPIRTFQNKNGNTIIVKRYYITDLFFERIELVSKAIRGKWE